MTVAYDETKILYEIFGLVDQSPGASLGELLQAYDVTRDKYNLSNDDECAIRIYRSLLGWHQRQQLPVKLRSSPQNGGNNKTSPHRRSPQRAHNAPHNAPPTREVEVEVGHGPSTQIRASSSTAPLLSSHKKPTPCGASSKAPLYALASSRVPSQDCTTGLNEEYTSNFRTHHHAVVPCQQQYSSSFHAWEKNNNRCVVVDDNIVCKPNRPTSAREDPRPLVHPTTYNMNASTRTSHLKNALGGGHPQSSAVRTPPRTPYSSTIGADCAPLLASGGFDQWNVHPAAPPSGGLSTTPWNALVEKRDAVLKNGYDVENGGAAAHISQRLNRGEDDPWTEYRQRLNREFLSPDGEKTQVRRSQEENDEIEKKIDRGRSTAEALYEERLSMNRRRYPRTPFNTWEPQTTVAVAFRFRSLLKLMFGHWCTYISSVHHACGPCGLEAMLSRHRTRLLHWSLGAWKECIVVWTHHDHARAAHQWTRTLFCAWRAHADTRRGLRHAAHTVAHRHVERVRRAILDAWMHRCRHKCYLDYTLCRAIFLAWRVHTRWSHTHGVPPLFAHWRAWGRRKRELRSVSVRAGSLLQRCRTRIAIRRWAAWRLEERHRKRTHHAHHVSRARSNARRALRFWHARAERLRRHRAIVDALERKRHGTRIVHRWVLATRCAHYRRTTLFHRCATRILAHWRDIARRHKQALECLQGRKRHRRIRARFSLWYHAMCDQRVVGAAMRKARDHDARRCMHKVLGHWRARAEELGYVALPRDSLIKAAFVWLRFSWGHDVMTCEERGPSRSHTNVFVLSRVGEGGMPTSAARGGGGAGTAAAATITVHAHHTSRRVQALERIHRHWRSHAFRQWVSYLAHLRRCALVQEFRCVWATFRAWASFLTALRGTVETGHIIHQRRLKRLKAWAFYAWLHTRLGKKRFVLCLHRFQVHKRQRLMFSIYRAWAEEWRYRVQCVQSAVRIQVRVRHRICGSIFSTMHRSFRDKKVTEARVHRSALHYRRRVLHLCLHAWAARLVHRAWRAHSQRRETEYRLHKAVMRWATECHRRRMRRRDEWMAVSMATHHLTRRCTNAWLAFTAQGLRLRRCHAHVETYVRQARLLHTVFQAWGLVRPTREGLIEKSMCVRATIEALRQRRVMDTWLTWTARGKALEVIGRHMERQCLRTAWAQCVLVDRVRQYKHMHALGQTCVRRFQRLLHAWRREVVLSKLMRRAQGAILAIRLRSRFLELKSNTIDRRRQQRNVLRFVLIRRNTQLLSILYAWRWDTTSLVMRQKVLRQLVTSHITRTTLNAFIAWKSWYQKHREVKRRAHTCQRAHEENRKLWVLRVAYHMQVRRRVLRAWELQRYAFAVGFGPWAAHVRERKRLLNVGLAIRERVCEFTKRGWWAWWHHRCVVREQFRARLTGHMQKMRAGERKRLVAWMWDVWVRFMLTKFRRRSLGRVATTKINQGNLRRSLHVWACKVVAEQNKRRAASSMSALLLRTMKRQNLRHWWYKVDCERQEAAYMEIASARYIRVKLVSWRRYTVRERMKREMVDLFRLKYRPRRLAEAFKAWVRVYADDLRLAVQSRRLHNLYQSWLQLRAWKSWCMVLSDTLGKKEQMRVWDDHRRLDMLIEVFVLWHGEMVRWREIRLVTEAKVSVTWPQMPQFSSRQGAGENREKKRADDCIGSFLESNHMAYVMRDILALWYEYVVEAQERVAEVGRDMRKKRIGVTLHTWKAQVRARKEITEDRRMRRCRRTFARWQTWLRQRTHMRTQIQHISHRIAYRCVQDTFFHLANACLMQQAERISLRPWVRAWIYQLHILRAFKAVKSNAMERRMKTAWRAWFAYRHLAHHDLKQTLAIHCIRVQRWIRVWKLSYNLSRHLGHLQLHVIHSWSHLNAWRRTAERHVARWRMDHTRSLLMVVFQAWRDTASLKAQLRRQASSRTPAITPCPLSSGTSTPSSTFPSHSSEH